RRGDGAAEAAVANQASCDDGPISVNPAPINVVSEGLPYTNEPCGTPPPPPIVTLLPTVLTVTEPLPLIITESWAPLTFLTTCAGAMRSAVTPAGAIPRVTFPDTPPPISPVPAVTPVIVPPPDVAAIVSVLPDGMIEIFGPGARVISPEREFRVLTRVRGA